MSEEKDPFFTFSEEIVKEVNEIKGKEVYKVVEENDTICVMDLENEDIAFNISLGLTPKETYCLLVGFRRGLEDNNN